MPVVWEPYIEPPVSGDEVALALASLEEQAAISLPQDVRQLILSHAGQVTEPSGITLDGPLTVPFGPIFYAGGTKSHKRYTYSIEFVLSNLVGWAEVESPEALGLFPFASGDALGYFCLDYRADRKRPQIVFVYLEFDFTEPNAIRLAAPDLPTLLEKLKD